MLYSQNSRLLQLVSVFVCGSRRTKHSAEGRRVCWVVGPALARVTAEHRNGGRLPARVSWVVVVRRER